MFKAEMINLKSIRLKFQLLEASTKLNHHGKKNDQ